LKRIQLVIDVWDIWDIWSNKENNNKVPLAQKVYVLAFDTFLYGQLVSFENNMDLPVVRSEP